MKRLTFWRVLLVVLLLATLADLVYAWAHRHLLVTLGRLIFGFLIGALISDFRLLMRRRRSDER